MSNNMRPSPRFLLTSESFKNNPEDYWDYVNRYESKLLEWVKLCIKNGWKGRDIILQFEKERNYGAIRSLHFIVNYLAPELKNDLLVGLEFSSDELISLHRFMSHKNP